jgi:hypothetical protein
MVDDRDSPRHDDIVAYHDRGMAHKLSRAEIAAITDVDLAFGTVEVNTAANDRFAPNRKSAAFPDSS